MKVLYLKNISEDFNIDSTFGKYCVSIIEINNEKYKISQ